jgi:hypothetical protein
MDAIRDFAEAWEHKRVEYYKSSNVEDKARFKKTMRDIAYGYYRLQFLHSGMGLQEAEAGALNLIFKDENEGYVVGVI